MPVNSSESVHSRFAISTSDAAALRPTSVGGIATPLAQTVRADVAGSGEILGRSEQDWARSNLVGLCEEPVADCHQPVLQSALATELQLPVAR